YVRTHHRSDTFQVWTCRARATVLPDVVASAGAGCLTSVKNPWWKMPAWDLDWPLARAWTCLRLPEAQPVLDERDLQPPSFSARCLLHSQESPPCGNHGRSHSSDLAPRDFLHQRSVGLWWPTLLLTQGGRKRAGHRSQTCPLGQHHLGIPDGKA